MDHQSSQQETGADGSERRWQEQLEHHLHRIIHHADDTLDLARQRLYDRFQWQKPASVQPFMGYVDASGLQLTGRVLANPAMETGPLERDRWWRNLLDTYRRFASREVGGAEVRLQLNEKVVQLRTDQEGYYRMRSQAFSPTDDYLQSIPLRVSHRGRTLSADHPFIAPAEVVGGGVAMISDIDDTILHTTSMRLLTAARLTFLHSARTRKPLDGVAALYRAFHDNGTRPIFYVSSSPWNLHDLLVDFLHLNDIPPGPMLLRDWGVDEDKLIASEGHGHKADKIQSLLDGYPDWQFVLVGDSGQEDGDIYSGIARDNPDRILAIYIRDVRPDQADAWDGRVDRLISGRGDHDVPLLKAGDSRAIAAHLHTLGLLSDAENHAVDADAKNDQTRTPI